MRFLISEVPLYTQGPARRSSRAHEREREREGEGEREGERERENSLRRDMYISFLGSCVGCSMRDCENEGRAARIDEQKREEKIP